MEQGELISQEFRNTGTLWSNNKTVDRNGYLVVKGILMLYLEANRKDYLLQQLVVKFKEELMLE